MHKHGCLLLATAASRQLSAHMPRALQRVSPGPRLFRSRLPAVTHCTLQVLGCLYRQEYTDAAPTSRQEGARSLLVRLGSEHLPLLEASLLGALDAPDCGYSLAATVRGVYTCGRSAWSCCAV